MNYEESLKYINQSCKYGIRLGLGNMKLLLQTLGNPQSNYKIIHVAGTNGKGSTSCMIESVLREEGYRVGLYTSPYLEVINEIIRFNGDIISNENFAESVCIVKTAIDDIRVNDPDFSPTEYEITTAVAFVYFEMKKAEFVVLEVGMGGRMDATNIVEDTLVSVITPIAMDHMQYLGDSIEKIAYEKSGIIKKDSIVVSSAQRENVYKVIKRAADDNKASFVKAEDSSIEVISYDLNGQVVKFTYNEFILTFKLALLGEYQIKNSQTALVTLITLIYNGIRISNDSIINGIEKARWPGRFEIVNKDPIVVIDGAHNVDGMKVLASSVKRYFGGAKIILVLGILKDKDYKDMVRIIVPEASEVIVTEPRNERKLSALELEEVVRKYNSNVTVCINDIDAVKKAMSTAKPDEVVCIAGSLYLLGKIRGLFHGPSGRN